MSGTCSQHTPQKRLLRPQVNFTGVYYTSQTSLRSSFFFTESFLVESISLMLRGGFIIESIAIEAVSFCFSAGIETLGLGNSWAKLKVFINTVKLKKKSMFILCVRNAFKRFGALEWFMSACSNTNSIRADSLSQRFQPGAPKWNKENEKQFYLL